MNNNCQHTDAEWRALQEQVAEARRVADLSSWVLRKAIAEIEDYIRERAA